MFSAGRKEKRRNKKEAGSKGKVVSLKLQANIPVVTNPRPLPPPVVRSFLTAPPLFL